MIKLHCTKKLLAKLPTDEQGYLSLSRTHDTLERKESHAPSPLSGWHANLLTIQRRNCVLLIHDTTRFPLFIPALTKPGFAKLDYWFGDALMNTLMKCGASGEQMEHAWAAVERLQIDTQCDRSVQGTLNQAGQDTEHSLNYHGVNVAEIAGYQAAAWLAGRPCTVKGRKDFIWPEKAFLALLDTLPQASDQQSDDSMKGAQINDEPSLVLPDNVLSMESFRNKD